MRWEVNAITIIIRVFSVPTCCGAEDESAWPDAATCVTPLRVSRRARHERGRSRTRDRALLALQQAGDALALPAPPAAARLRLAYAVAHPLGVTVKKELGEGLIAMGLVGACSLNPAPYKFMSSESLQISDRVTPFHQLIVRLCFRQVSHIPVVHMFMQKVCHFDATGLLLTASSTNSGVCVGWHWSGKLVQKMLGVCTGGIKCSVFFYFLFLLGAGSALPMFEELELWDSLIVCYQMLGKAPQV